VGRDKKKYNANKKHIQNLALDEPAGLSKGSRKAEKSTRRRWGQKGKLIACGCKTKRGEEEKSQNGRRIQQKRTRTWEDLSKKKQKIGKEGSSTQRKENVCGIVPYPSGTWLGLGGRSKPSRARGERGQKGKRGKNEK